MSVPTGEESETEIRFPMLSITMAVGSPHREGDLHIYERCTCCACNMVSNPRIDFGSIAWLPFLASQLGGMTRRSRGILFKGSGYTGEFWCYCDGVARFVRGLAKVDTRCSLAAVRESIVPDRVERKLMQVAGYLMSWERVPDK